MNKRKLCKVYNFILIMFLVFISTVIFNSKTLEKGIKTIQTKKLEQEGQNYRLVTSQDNVQVPVPKGYVASQVTGENYVAPEYQHTTNTYKGNYTQLNWSSPVGEQYPWTQDENGIWISGNQGMGNSESVIESEEFDYIKGTTLTINYTYSCGGNGDWFYIYIINTTTNKISTIKNQLYGNYSSSFDYTKSNYTYTADDWATGRYKIKAVYKKYRNGSQGQDSGYIKGATYFKEDENGETIEVDEKTRIHDGGFVIYQLKDEEIETDPNGTNVIINDTNKDRAQSERNQYVWVPVPNIEDITRTKMKNNGILQFGQGYEFNNTSILKEINTYEIYYFEPRLLEREEKTKRNLQRYTTIKRREIYLSEQQEEFNNMINSVRKYKGFYIGRYETGDDYEHDYNPGCYIKPKVVRYSINLGRITWYNGYKDLQKLSGKTDKYVETGMMFDTTWEYTLKWLNETDTRSYEDINKDSGTWGNYVNNSIKYKESASESEKIKEEGEEIFIPTGGVTEITYKGVTYSDSPTASNNIFDIAGNAWEWTRAKGEYQNTRMYRNNTCYDYSDERTASFFSYRKSVYYWRICRSS